MKRANWMNCHLLAVLILALPFAGMGLGQSWAAGSGSKTDKAAEGSTCKLTERGCDASCSGTCPWNSDAPAGDTNGWTRIFDGKDLAGWEVMGKNKDAFHVKDGSIECNGQGGWWVRYDKEVSNFILRLEYKISQGGNSGVFLRATKDGDPPFTGFEVQVLDDNGKPPDKHTSGSIYDVLTPMVNMSKPAGEWNEYIIKCDGPHVTVCMNGMMVIDTNFDWFTKPIGKFSTPYAQLPRSGYIGMQDHGGYVWYRNIWLKKLP